MNLPKLVGYLILIWLPSADFEISTSPFRLNKHENAFRSNGNVDFVDNVDSNETGEKSSSGNVGFSQKKTPAATTQAVNSHKNYHSRKSAKGNIGKEFVTTRIVGRSAHSVVRNVVVKRQSALTSDNNSTSDMHRGGSWKRSARTNTYVTYETGTGRRKLLETVTSTTDDGGKREDKTTKKMKNYGSKGKHLQVTTLPDDYEDDSNESKPTNGSELGSYLGGPCETTCSEKLSHVVCDQVKRICECEEKYPVQIGPARGCEKPKQLGDQCFYEETCSFFDSNAECTQINHNAICQCKPGFHTVALRKGVKKMFCSEDIVVVSADLPTLLGVATGIAVLTGLLCFVLKLFSGNRYPATRHYGNANLAPPLLFSNDNQWINGIPLTVQGRSSSRASCQRSTPSLSQYPRPKGVLVPASRAGAARAAAILLIPCHLQPSRHSDSEVDSEEVDGRENAVEPFSRIGSRRHSLTSVHSTTSSQKSMSYSARRFEQENQQREQRAAMKAAREEAVRLVALPTPSPCSTEDILLINTSTNNEEDFLCSSTTDALAQSEPPALLFKKGNAEEPLTYKTLPATANNPG